MPKISEIERTPNPNAIRFVLKDPISQGVTRSYESAEQASKDPFATQLFEAGPVVNVYYVDKYVTVTQDGSMDWNELLRLLAPPIREAEAIGILETDDEEVHASKEAQNDPRLTQINEMLDEQVRPYLLADGGGLKVMGLEDNILRVHYQGACGTCPTATSGTLYAIESMVKRMHPEIEIQSV